MSSPNSNSLSLQVSPEDAGRRLDQWLAEKSALSRHQVQKAIREGRVLSPDGQAAQRAKQSVQAQEIYIIHILEIFPTTAKPQKMPLDIVYEDSSLLVLNKPAGLVVHPGAGNHDRTLINGLLAHCEQELSQMNGLHRPGIVHRLDKDTSGLLVVAKNDSVHQALQQQFQHRTIKRLYQALIWGVLMPPAGEIERGIMRHPRHPQKMMASASTKARYALTNYRVIRHFADKEQGPCSLIECRLATGRTHQIRVHCAYVGHPLVGDPLYGRKRQGGKSEVKSALAGFARQALHARTLGFSHPTTGEEMIFEAPIPPDFADLLRLLNASDAKNHVPFSQFSLLVL